MHMLKCVYVCFYTYDYTRVFVQHVLQICSNKYVIAAMLVQLHLIMINYACRDVDMGVCTSAFVSINNYM